MVRYYGSSVIKSHQRQLAKEPEKKHEQRGLYTHYIWEGTKGQTFMNNAKGYFSKNLKMNMNKLDVYNLYSISLEFSRSNKKNVQVYYFLNEQRKRMYSLAYKTRFHLIFRLPA